MPDRHSFGLPGCKPRLKRGVKSNRALGTDNGKRNNPRTTNIGLLGAQQKIVQTFCRIHDKLPQPNATWQRVVPYTLTDSQLNFTLPTHDHSAVQLRAVNKVGMSEPAFLTIQPPMKKVSGSNSGYSSIFEPLNHVTGVLTYSLLSVGLILLLLLMIIVFVYRRK
ncbi:unnamed protein product [Echinostoma caproni]|uniref:Protein PBN1 n=1 Tax=Echinostoma caproni TaxID=27848 RepID=A0A183AVK5_9TREM|nr:unnamed protein product [Echinostoma caproni]